MFADATVPGVRVELVITAVCVVVRDTRECVEHTDTDYGQRAMV
jgi:hypothetical protein